MSITTIVIATLVETGSMELTIQSGFIYFTVWFCLYAFALISDCVIEYSKIIINRVYRMNEIDKEINWTLWYNTMAHVPLFVWSLRIYDRHEVYLLDKEHYFWLTVLIASFQCVMNAFKILFIHVPLDSKTRSYFDIESEPSAIDFKPLIRTLPLLTIIATNISNVIMALLFEYDLAKLNTAKGFIYFTTCFFVFGFFLIINAIYNITDVDKKVTWTLRHTVIVYLIMCFWSGKIYYRNDEIYPKQDKTFWWMVSTLSIPNCMFAIQRYLALSSNKSKNLKIPKEKKEEKEEKKKEESEIRKRKLGSQEEEDEWTEVEEKKKESKKDQ